MMGPGGRGAGCNRTEEVLQAERTGRLSDELAMHLADCTSCSDALLVEEMLAADAEVAFREAELPAAAVVWLRASLAERYRDERRALRPITVWEGVAGAAAAGVTVLMVPGIKSLLSGWASSALPESALSLLGSGVPASGLVLAGLAVPLLALVAGVAWVWADS